MSFVYWRVWGSLWRIRRQVPSGWLLTCPFPNPGGGWLSALLPPSSGVSDGMLCPSLGSSESAPQGTFLLTALLGAGTPRAYFCACWRPFSRVTLAGDLLLALLPMGKLQALVEEGRSHALGCSLAAGTEELLTCAPANAWKRIFAINVWLISKLMFVKIS